MMIVVEVVLFFVVVVHIVEVGWELEEGIRMLELAAVDILEHLHSYLLYMNSLDMMMEQQVQQVLIQ